MLEPAGRFTKVDGRNVSLNNTSSWKKRVSHVPQSIFLADASIEANIAVCSNEGEIDSLAVEESARRAQALSFIDEIKGRFQALTGERGVGLSGGQRQRLGLARAFYKGGDILILDEATSALDELTEHHIIEEITNAEPKQTVIMVAHRMSTLTNCDKILKLSRGTVEVFGPYHQVISGKGK